MAILADANACVLVQGITGRDAVDLVQANLDYGARIVAGVTPGKGGATVFGVPVYDTVAEALARHRAQVSVIVVPPSSVLDASREAIDNGLKLIVILTERVPRKDVVQLLEYALMQGARAIGPNSLGLISPGQTRIGMLGGPVADARLSFMPGQVGIMSRSGGMVTEIASMLTQAGIGQSTCISIGGDPIVGSAFVDLLPLFEADPATSILTIFCEPGGRMEEDLNARLKNQPSRLPIVSFVAGRFTDRLPGIRFGHAGAIVQGRYGSPAAKAETLAALDNVQVAQRISDIPRLVQTLLDQGA
jgi:succinyl-CoA synthetase alpha subunit